MSRYEVLPERVGMFEYEWPSRVSKVSKLSKGDKVGMSKYE